MVNTDDEEVFSGKYSYTHSCYLRYSSPVSRLTSKTVGKGEQGRNELTMSNMPGREQVYLKAEKDYEELVQHDYNQTILNNKTSSVTGSHTENILQAHIQNCKCRWGILNGSSLK